MFAKEIRDSNNNARPVISSYIMPQNSESITIPRKEYDLLVKQSALPAYMNENQREKLRSYRDNMFEKDEVRIYEQSKHNKNQFQKIKDLETRLKKSDENNVKFQTDIEVCSYLSNLYLIFYSISTIKSKSLQKIVLRSKASIKVSLLITRF
jgi:hypothetical protein